MLKRLLAVSTAMFLTLATFAFAAELRGDHPSTYTVQKGDTLWDISAKFLTKPWLWPEIWQANPQVKNPHLIYPGDVLSLVYINGQPQVAVTSDPGPQIRVGEAIDTIPLSEIETWLKEKTVVQDPKTFPYVIGVEDDHLFSTAGHVVYVRGLAGAQPGQQVQVARPDSYFEMGKVKDGRRTGGLTPLDFNAYRGHIHWGYGDAPTEAHGGQKLGYELNLHALGEVTQVKGDVAIVLLHDEVNDVHVGDRVLPVEERPYCNCFTPHPATGNPPGQILAVDNGVLRAGARMVVALSVGTQDGVDNGTVFSIWHEGAVRPDTVAHRNLIAAYADRIAMPDEFVGHVMVFRTFDKVSYGLVMETIEPARIGDLLKHPDALQ